MSCAIWQRLCQFGRGDVQSGVVLQGHMSGKDFARSVVCSVHTNEIEDYLAKVDAMPTPLANAQV